MNNSLQALVAEFNRSLKNRIERHARVLDLASEVGEVCKLAFSEKINVAVDFNLWEEELADSLYSLLSLMNDMEIDADKALKSVLKKYEDRLVKNGQMQSGR
jgi:NTP pyrophosphatase (non-canonical NTP hydrolase)